MSETKAIPTTETKPPKLLLDHYLKTLRLPSFKRECEKQAGLAAKAGDDHVKYLLRLTELELIDREQRLIERRIRAAKFPAVKSLDTFGAHRHSGERGVECSEFRVGGKHLAQRCHSQLDLCIHLGRCARKCSCCCHRGIL